MPAIDDVFYAIEIMEKEKLDFDDALVVACSGEGAYRSASLDKHFDKVRKLKGLCRD